MANRYDVFVCHASEDKDAIARPLAEMLRREGLSVWYDEFSLTPGDSLRHSIDVGLRDSTFGVVIISNEFFKKAWANRELSALFSRHISSRYNVIIPVWHNVDADQVRSASPLMSDLVSIHSNGGVADLAKKIIDATKKLSHDVVKMTDHLLIKGGKNPVAYNFYGIKLRAKTPMSHHRIGDLTSSGKIILHKFRGGQCSLVSDGGAKAIVWHFPEKRPGEEFSLFATLKLLDSYDESREMHTCLMYRTVEDFRTIVSFPAGRQIHNVVGEVYFDSLTSPAPNFSYDPKSARAEIREKYPVARSRYQIWWEW